MNLESLEPYQRYTFTLHTRANKAPCNLKHINSESTYGSVQAYLTEGCESVIAFPYVISLPFI